MKLKRAVFCQKRKNNCSLLRDPGKSTSVFCINKGGHYDEK